jgi:anaerobic ribonucleoside-triphosphate reductase activating protein
MRYAGIIKNDFASAPGTCVTFFTQGCARHCPGCHNPETWDFNGGKEFTQDTINSIIEAISANGVKRNFCVMGGEPLHPDNLFLTNLVIQEVKKVYPNIKVYLWTGYTYEELLDRDEKIL